MSFENPPQPEGEGGENQNENEDGPEDNREVEYETSREYAEEMNQVLKELGGHIQELEKLKGEFEDKEEMRELSSKLTEVQKQELKQLQEEIEEDLEQAEFYLGGLDLPGLLTVADKDAERGEPLAKTSALLAYPFGVPIALSGAGVHGLSALKKKIEQKWKEYDWTDWE